MFVSPVQIVSSCGTLALLSVGLFSCSDDDVLITNASEHSFEIKASVRADNSTVEEKKSFSCFRSLHTQTHAPMFL